MESQILKSTNSTKLNVLLRLLAYRLIDTTEEEDISEEMILNKADELEKLYKKNMLFSPNYIKTLIECAQEMNDDDLEKALKNYKRKQRKETLNNIKNILDEQYEPNKPEEKEEESDDFAELDLKPTAEDKKEQMERKRKEKEETMKKRIEDFAELNDIEKYIENLGIKHGITKDKILRYYNQNIKPEIKKTEEGKSQTKDFENVLKYFMKAIDNIKGEDEKLTAIEEKEKKTQAENIEKQRKIGAKMKAKAEDRAKKELDEKDNKIKTLQDELDELKKKNASEIKIPNERVKKVFDNLRNQNIENFEPWQAVDYISNKYPELSESEAKNLYVNYLKHKQLSNITPLMRPPKDLRIGFGGYREQNEQLPNKTITPALNSQIEKFFNLK